MAKMTFSGKAEIALDWEAALSQAGGDRQLLAELCRIFLQDCPHLLDTARESIKNADPLGLERAAHTLCGRLAFFGLVEARERALKLEMTGRKKDLNRALEAFAGIETEMESLLPQFDSFAREQGL
jgi:HPt (histidine-containing phosphotransfer) domain-containing protein